MQMTMTKTKVSKLIVDGDHAAHRAFHAYEELRTTDGRMSGAFYGFFSILLRKIEDLGPQTVAVCWGDRRENLARKDIWPDYKGNRTFSSDDLRQQITDIQSALFSMDIRQYYSHRQEADDCIATLAHTLPLLLGEDEKLVILTGDKDMLQLVTPVVHVISPAVGFQKHDKLYTPKDVFEKYGVHPDQMADYLALVGDTSDNVPGVAGIGPVKAVELLNTFGPIKTWYSKIADGTLNVAPALLKKLQACQRELVVSKKLVSLASVDVVMIDPVSATDESGVSADEIFDMYEMVKIRPEHLTAYLLPA